MMLNSHRYESYNCLKQYGQVEVTFSQSVILKEKYSDDYYRYDVRYEYFLSSRNI